ncbi:hypothetical protein [Tsukamurella tyrosinosolvens]|uniref:hypothetical protein n=1 Tax=Tsukamurella tyrosinosolvens TaxID=57704 RepID=UPI000C7F6759|nr:hypothetical protein [Tsukamurella tyrosinosolvens]AUN38793.1 hypothetical protein ASU32_01215 [Tsukamurella tyrosinosolvens]
MFEHDGLFAQQQAQEALGKAVIPLMNDQTDAVKIVVDGALKPVSRFRFYAERKDGTVESILARGFDDGVIDNLRAAMYQQGLGTWFSAVIRVNRSGAVDAEFNYDDEPDWNTVDPIAYLTDQEAFPRDRENQPQWLQEKVAEGVKRRHELGFE